MNADLGRMSVFEKPGQKSDCMVVCMVRCAGAADGCLGPICLVSSYQHGPAIDVQNLSGDKAGVGSAEKQHRGRDFLWFAGPTEGNGAEHPLADLRLPQRAL